MENGSDNQAPADTSPTVRKPVRAQQLIQPVLPPMGTHAFVNTDDWIQYESTAHGFSFLRPPHFDAITELSTPAVAGVQDLLTLSDGAEHSTLLISSIDATLQECVDQAQQSTKKQRKGTDSALLFMEDTVNDTKVVFHKRNFGGAIGNVFAMFVADRDGRCLRFSSEGDHRTLETIYRSFTLLQ